MTKKQKANYAIDKLKLRYQSELCSLEYNKEKPYELLIATRLSAQCTDARVNIVTRVLFKKYTTLHEIANANLNDIEKILYPCGFYKVKSKDTIHMAQQLINKFNGELPSTMEELTSLSGIGRKTANLILGDIFDKPAIVVDTHCIRITGRLGLISKTINPEKIEIELRKILNPIESNNFCHRLVLFGREICSARSPKCNDCEMYICKQNPNKIKIQKA